MKTLQTTFHTVEEAQAEIDRIAEASQADYVGTGTLIYAHPPVMPDPKEILDENGNGTGEFEQPPLIISVTHEAQERGAVMDLPMITKETMGEFIVDKDKLQAANTDADSNIKKLVGNIKNYVADLTEGVRTDATDLDVDALIDDGNIVITNE